MQTHKLLHRRIEELNAEFTNNPISPMQGHLNHRKYNRTHCIYSANITITDYIDKRYKLGLELQKWGDGGWKRNVVSYESNDPCNQLKLTIGPGFKRIMDFFKHPAMCPFQPGFYYFDDYIPVLDENYFSPLILNLGKQKTVVQFFNKDGIAINRFQIIFEVFEFN